MQLEWSIEGEKQLSRRLRIASNAFQDMSKPFENSAKKLTKVYSNDVFKTEGSVIGEKWARLSPATVARKARAGMKQPSKPLVGTGAMQKSFRYQHGKDFALIENVSDYFKYHQSNQARSRIPRRIMMKIAESQKTLVVRIFQKYLKEQLNK